MTNVEKALELVSDGMTLGLGSGKASERFVTALGERVRAGLRVRGVPTSSGTAALAQKVGVPLVSLAEGMPMDICFDGADEVDPNLDLLKGWGHALIQEKVVAAASKMFVVLVGPENTKAKLVKTLGERGRLPVEVVPFGLALVVKRLAELGMPGEEPLKKPDGGLFVSDNGNYILEPHVGPITDPAKLDRDLRDIPGVVGTGLFLKMAHMVIVEDDGKVEVRRRS
jgi:ribose 5-phosphate isomerase A